MTCPEDLHHIEHEFARATDFNTANPAVQAYFNFYYDCCKSIRQADAETIVPRTTEWSRMLARPFEQVMASAIAGNTEDWMDLSLRYVEYSFIASLTLNIRLSQDVRRVWNA